MRVLLATDGTWGDVGPPLALAHALRERGHEVRALLNPSFADAAERLGLEVDQAGVPWEERLSGVDPAKLMTPVSGTLRVLRDLILPEVPSWALATERALEEFRPDVGLVHHVCWGPLAKMHQRQLPLAATFLAPAVLLSGDDPGRLVAALPPPPRFAARASRVLARVMFRRLIDRPARIWFERAGLAAPRDLYWLAQRSAQLALALWSPTFRGPVPDDPPNLRIAGYVFPVEPEPLAPELDAFLAAGERPVVVTLGTSARQIGLDLYRAAAEACAQIGRRAVLLTGDAKNRPDPLPDGVAAFDEAPHGRLFRRACAIVHHAGAGTCAQALRAGKPAVIVPFGHDQADNAYRAQPLGGMRIVARRRATRAGLARALADLLGSAEARAAADRTGDLLRGEDGPGEAARLIESMGRE